MDMLKLLEKEHSKKQCDRIVKYIGKDKARFAELMRLFFKGEYRITQRAAWPMIHCVRLHPGLILPYFGSLLDNLAKKATPDAVVRNALRLLQDVKSPLKYHGRVMSLCFDLVQTPETSIAVRAFSLTVLGQFSATYPDILAELKLIIAEQWDQATPAFRSRARRLLKNIPSNIVTGS
jgi:hypothetical protein